MRHRVRVHSVSGKTIDQLNALGYGLVHLHRPWFGGALPRESDELLREPAGTHKRAPHSLQPRTHGMADGGSTDRFELLRLEQLKLQSFAIGDVAHDTVRSHELARTRSVRV